MKFTTPPASPIFMMPNQSVMRPMYPNEIVAPVSAMEKRLSTMAGKTVMSPQKSSFTSPVMKAMRKKPTQM